MKISTPLTTALEYAEIDTIRKKFLDLEMRLYELAITSYYPDELTTDEVEFNGKTYKLCACLRPHLDKICVFIDDFWKAPNQKHSPDTWHTIFDQFDTILGYYERHNYIATTKDLEGERAELNFTYKKCPYPRPTTYYSDAWIRDAAIDAGYEET